MTKGKVVQMPSGKFHAIMPNGHKLCLMNGETRRFTTAERARAALDKELAG